MDASAGYRPLPVAVKARRLPDLLRQTSSDAVVRSRRGGNAQTSRTLRRRALRSTACVTRPATVQTSEAPVGATRCRAEIAELDGRQQPDRCSPLATTRAGLSRPTALRPDPGRAALGPAGTDRQQTAPRGKGRSAATRQSLASRRRCTRRANSRRGIVREPTSARPPRRARHQACRPAPSRAGRRDRTPRLVPRPQSGQAWAGPAWTGPMSEIRVRRSAAQAYPGNPDGRAPGAGPGSQPYPQLSRQGATPDAPPASRYYAQGPGSAAEPGYPMLAVSDPAADVTSTQTWQAAGDGRATGVWTAPPRP